jgi:hypothetical protein
VSCGEVSAVRGVWESGVGVGGEARAWAVGVCVGRSGFCLRVARVDMITVHRGRPMIISNDARRPDDGPRGVCCAFRRAYPARAGIRRGAGAGPRAPAARAPRAADPPAVPAHPNRRAADPPQLSEYGPWGRGLGTRFSFRLCVTLRRTCSYPL